MVISRSGVFSDSSSQEGKLLETKLITPENNKQATAADVNKLQHIEDAYTTKTAINPTKYPEEYGMLLAYPDGTSFIVTYYHQTLPEIDTKMTVADISGRDDDIHKDLTEIKNFELRLLNELDRNYEDDDGSFTINGEALIYPGFTPRIGDIILFEVSEGSVGEFRVDSVTPTSYRESRYHRITFTLKDYINVARYNDIQRNVRIRYIFDKKQYLNTGKLTFLTEQSYIDLKTLERYRKELIKYYMDKFYSRPAESIVRPDGIYDPYIVKFIQFKFTSKDYRYRAKQLYSRLDNYNRSIWYHITHVYDKKYLLDINRYMQIQYHQSKINMTDHNALINNNFLYLVDKKSAFSSCEADDHYFLSPNFFNEDLTHMTDNELMLFKYLKEGTCDLDRLIRLLDKYKRMSDLDKFYYMPIYIELVDYSIRNLKH